METLLLCTICVIVGWKLSTFWNVIAFKKLLEDLGISQQQLAQLKTRLESHGDVPGLAELADSEQEPQKIVEVKLERHEGILFAFRKDNDQFLAQGADREALIQRLTENLTPCRVVIAKEDGADLISS
jgi:hypothetical protein